MQINKELKNKPTINTPQQRVTSFKEGVVDFAFKHGTLAVIFIVVLYFSVTNPYFLTYGNITDILRSISIVTLVALGVTFSLIVNGFDLSVGSTVSLTTVVSASLMVWYEQGLFLVILVPIGAVLIGVLLNGLTMLNLPYYAYDIVKGSVLLLALAITYYQLRNRG